MKMIKSLLSLVLSLFVFGSLVTAQNPILPSKGNVLKSMELANGYFMKKWPDVGKEIVTTKARPSNIWTRAVYYEGLMELYTIKPRKEYLDYAVSWGEFHKWGLRDGVRTRNADNQCCGQTYINLYMIDKKQKPERIRDIKTSIDSMLHSSKINDWTWIDAIQMAMPVFAQLGTIYNDNHYFERMFLMYMYSRDKEGGCGLYNVKDSLWWRDKDFVPPYKEPNGEDCYWSRGNGWVVAALVRVMSIVPKNTPHYNDYMHDYKQMMHALVPLQRKDGLWNVSLHDSTNFGGKELSASALFIYGMAWGVNRGVLDAKIYKPIIAKTWNAMVNDCLHPDGLLGWVQGTGKEPKDGQPLAYDKIPDFEDYGLGCFLLAGSEVYKMK